MRFTLYAHTKSRSWSKLGTMTSVAAVASQGNAGIGWLQPGQYTDFLIKTVFSLVKPSEKEANK